MHKYLRSSYHPKVLASKPLTVYSHLLSSISLWGSGLISTSTIAPTMRWKSRMHRMCRACSMSPVFVVASYSRLISHVRKYAGPTNEEVPPSYYEGRLRTGSECLICSCGRDTSSGTEGSFDLCDISSGSVIAHIYWDCVAVGTNKFEISTEGSNYNYWKVQSQNHPSTGPLGDLRISVTRDY